CRKDPGPGAALRPTHKEPDGEEEEDPRPEEGVRNRRPPQRPPPASAALTQVPQHRQGNQRQEQGREGNVRDRWHETIIADRLTHAPGLARTPANVATGSPLQRGSFPV